MILIKYKMAVLLNTCDNIIYSFNHLNLLASLSDSIKCKMSPTLHGPSNIIYLKNII